MPSACPACHALSITRQTEVCPRCRFVVRAQGPSTSRAAEDIIKAGNSVLNILLGVAAGMAILGMVAAVAVTFLVSRTEHVSLREKEEEGVHLLRRVFALEHNYYDQNSAYAGDPQLLQPLGWKDADARWYSIRISSTYRDGFCLEADPVAGGENESAPRPMSMNADGFLFQQNGCTGTVDMSRSGIDR